ncbi:MAG: hypothetical protein OXR72_12445 [Gemmatimonadota bacterium]|nr:hypothetical protein [Gemmatimonadota bacterium]
MKHPVRRVSGKQDSNIRTILPMVENFVCRYGFHPVQIPSTLLLTKPRRDHTVCLYQRYLDVSLNSAKAATRHRDETFQKGAKWSSGHPANPDPDGVCIQNDHPKRSYFSFIAENPDQGEKK